MMMDALGQQEQPALSPRVLELLDGFLGSVGSAPTER
jgi:hypothetical protein